MTQNGGKMGVQISLWIYCVHQKADTKLERGQSRKNEDIGMSSVESHGGLRMVRFLHWGGYHTVYI